MMAHLLTFVRKKIVDLTIPNTYLVGCQRATHARLTFLLLKLKGGCLNAAALLFCQKG
jgi:hypothetical protein